MVDDTFCVIVLAGCGEYELLLGSKADAPSQLLSGLAGSAFGSTVLTVLNRLKDERLDGEAGSAASVGVILGLVELFGDEIEAFSEATVEPVDSLVKTGRGVIEVLEVDVSTAAVTVGFAASTGDGAVGTPAGIGILPTLALISVERAYRYDARARLFAACPLSKLVIAALNASLSMLSGQCEEPRLINTAFRAKKPRKLMVETVPFVELKPFSNSPLDTLKQDRSHRCQLGLQCDAHKPVLCMNFACGAHLMIITL